MLQYQTKHYVCVLSRFLLSIIKFQGKEQRVILAIKELEETLVIQEILVLVVAKAKLVHKDQKDSKDLEDWKVIRHHCHTIMGNMYKAQV